LDGSGTISILVKPLGGWTSALRRHFFPSADLIVPAAAAAAAADALPCNYSSAGSGGAVHNKTAASLPGFSFKARVEGPYGDESDFYLKYVLQDPYTHTDTHTHIPC
jgi:hypothetical protein